MIPVDWSKVPDAPDIAGPLAALDAARAACAAHLGSVEAETEMVQGRADAVLARAGDSTTDARTLWIDVSAWVGRGRKCLTELQRRNRRLGWRVRWLRFWRSLGGPWRWVRGATRRRPDRGGEWWRDDR